MAADAPSLTLLFTVQEAGRGISLLKPGSITVDTLRSEVYLTDRGRKEIFVYKESGQFLQLLGRDLEINTPYHLLVDPSGALIVGEQDLSKLWILDLKGGVEGEVSLEAGDVGGFLPGGMSLDSGYNFLVVNRFGDSVVRVNRSAQSVDLFYSHPGDQQDIMELQDVIQVKDGMTILLSSLGNAVRILDGAGKTRIQFGEHGSREHQFSFPSAFALGPEGNLWIVDTFQHKVKVFEQDGTFVKEYGEMGTEPGRFFFPIDIAFGSGGRLFILEKGIARFQVFELKKRDVSNPE